MRNARMIRIGGTTLALMMMAAVLVVLPACETVKGAGKDVQNAGQAGSDAIDSAAGKNKK